MADRHGRRNAQIEHKLSRVESARWDLISFGNSSNYHDTSKKLQFQSTNTCPINLCHK